MLYDHAVHPAIEALPFFGVHRIKCFFVEAVVTCVREMGVIGTAWTEIFAVEEGQVVFSVGVVGYPGTPEKQQPGVGYHVPESGTCTDLDFYVDAYLSELMLNEFTQVTVIIGSG